MGWAKPQAETDDVSGNGLNTYLRIALTRLAKQLLQSSLEVPEGLVSLLIHAHQPELPDPELLKHPLNRLAREQVLLIARVP